MKKSVRESLIRNTIPAIFLCLSAKLVAPFVVLLVLGSKPFLWYTLVWLVTENIRVVHLDAPLIYNVNRIINGKNYFEHGWWFVFETEKPRFVCLEGEARSCVPRFSNMLEEVARLFAECPNAYLHPRYNEELHTWNKMEMDKMLLSCGAMYNKLSQKIEFRTPPLSNVWSHWQISYLPTERKAPSQDVEKISLEMQTRSVEENECRSSFLLFTNFTYFENWFSKDKACNLLRAFSSNNYDCKHLNT